MSLRALQLVAVDGEQRAMRILGVLESAARGAGVAVQPDATAKGRQAHVRTMRSGQGSSRMSSLIEGSRVSPPTQPLSQETRRRIAGPCENNACLRARQSSEVIQGEVTERRPPAVEHATHLKCGPEYRTRAPCSLPGFAEAWAPILFLPLKGWPPGVAET